MALQLFEQVIDTLVEDLSQDFQVFSLGNLWTISQIHIICADMHVALSRWKNGNAGHFVDLSTLADSKLGMGAGEPRRWLFRSIRPYCVAECISTLIN